jgi:hypothetical protein
MKSDEVPNHGNQEGTTCQVGDKQNPQVPQTTRVAVEVRVPPGGCLAVDVDAVNSSGELLERKTLMFQDGLPLAPLAEAVLPKSPVRPNILSQFNFAALSTWLFWCGLGLYAFTRLLALPDFPIYFFTDEAVQTVLASDLLRDHFHGPSHELLPAFFPNGSQYNLGVSVYWQVLPVLLFENSIWVTRSAAALASLLAAASVGVVLKRVFKTRYAWLGILFLAITPAWFLHSRTAFETGLATSFYAVFLSLYLLYRCENPRYLYGALAAGALAFYTYNPVRMVMLVTGVLLLVTDWRYHWRHRSLLPGALGLALVLALPFARFLILHPDASDWQMRLLGSYWVQGIPLWEKLSIFGLEYLRGLDPLYWYLPHTEDLPRHTMLHYGHLHRLTLPLGLFGIGLGLVRIRSVPYRVLLLALLAAPSGAALVRLGVTRALVIVIPMALLTTLAAIWWLELLHRRARISRSILSLLVFGMLGSASVFMLWDALVRGPYWFSDYGLTGQQYGASQVFGEIRQILYEQPNTRILLSPSWANGTDVIARFFFSDPIPFEMGSADGFYTDLQPLDENTLFVMIPEEFERIPGEKFSEVRVENVLPYPDGRPGFYFVRLKYVADIETLLAHEKEERRLPRQAQIDINGQPALVSHTLLDMGEVKHLFDGDPDTLVRTWAINPLALDATFSPARALHAVKLRVGGNPTQIVVTVWGEGQDAPVVYNREMPEVPRPREVSIELEGPVTAHKVRVEVWNADQNPESHVHLWEVVFEQD